MARGTALVQDKKAGWYYAVLADPQDP